MPAINESIETSPYSTSAEIEEMLLRIAKKCIEEGPGFAQEMVVLRRAAEHLQIGDDLKQQQRLLTAWQKLFRSGRLSWGYDVGNPSAPFFHVSVD